MEKPQVSLPEMFSIVATYFQTCLSSEAILQPTDEKLEELLEVCEQARTIVRAEAMFSRGEEIDEHPTTSIKVWMNLVVDIALPWSLPFQYLFLDYFIAKLHSSWRCTSEKMVHLVQARRQYEQFIDMCLSMNAIGEEDSREIRKREVFISSFCFLWLTLILLVFCRKRWK